LVVLKAEGLGRSLAGYLDLDLAVETVVNLENPSVEQMAENLVADLGLY